ncbi:MAG: Hint domain-containing protein [Candidatus Gracilibacteria bacterium]|nr:Hint domain-containing protein [Candidatus Gracilibacteria bacterium]
MGKTYAKVTGVWREITRKYVKVSGVWRNVVKAYQKVAGTWREIFSYNTGFSYTFTANAQNVDFAALIGPANVAAYSTFNIIVNPGVTISGTSGVAGANNSSTTEVAGNVGTRTCYSAYYGDLRNYSYNQYTAGSGTGYNFYFTGNGGNGGNGNSAFYFNGMSGKTINIINNGTIIGGNGGNGGLGARLVRTPIKSCGWCTKNQTACALPGSGGIGGQAFYNPNGNIINFSGNSPLSGNNGSIGGYSWTWYCNSSCTCFPSGTKILMADYSWKKIEDVKKGEFVIGMDNNPTLVLSEHKTYLGEYRTMFSFKDGSLNFSGEHPFWVRRTKEEYWGVYDIHQHIREDNIGTIVNEDGLEYNKHLLSKLPFILINNEEHAHIDGWKKQNAVILRDQIYHSDYEVYSLVTSGTHSFIANGYVVSGFAHDTGPDGCDYSKIKWNGLKNKQKKKGLSNE